MKTPRPHTFLRLALAAGFAFLLGSARAADFTSTWIGGNANWTSPANWSTPGAPGTFPNNGGSTYDAVISNGSVILLNQNITIQNFTLTASSLSGANTLTVAGLATLTAHSNSGSNGAILNGGSTTRAQGGLLINGGAGNVFIDGSSTVLENETTATWSSGGIAFGSAAKIKNLATGTFNNTFNGSVVNIGGGGTFENAGTFTKTTGTGTTTFGNTVAFNNTGTVNADSGTLAFSTLNMQAGTLTGAATANATTLNWSGGTLSGTGSTTVAGGTITTSDAKGLDRTLNNTGTITYSSPTGSSIQFGVGTSTPGVINNSGTFNVTGNGNFQITNANAGHAINNSGTWNSTGSGNSTINTGIAFNNTGSVNVSSGRNFVVLGGGTHTGSFSVSSGSTLSLIGGDTKLNSGSSITGAGNVVLGGGPGVTVNTGSTYNTTGDTRLAGGNATFNTNATTATFTGGTNQSHLTVSGASTKLTVNGSFTNNTEFTTLEGGAIVETTAFDLNGGELNGNGSINGPLTATGNGTLAPGASPGHITVNGSTVLGGTNTLAMEVGGLAAGIDYDLLTVNGVLTLGGLLDVDFINGFQNSVMPTDIFTIATSTSSILGAFSNVASGGLLSTNYSSQFRVYYGAGSPYGANNLVLTDAEAVPEPSRAVLMLGGLMGVILRRRRGSRV